MVHIIGLVRRFNMEGFFQFVSYGRGDSIVQFGGIYILLGYYFLTCYVNCVFIKSFFTSCIALFSN